MPRPAQPNPAVAVDGAAGGAVPMAETSHFPPALLYTAARLYYEDDATQAEVAEKLGTSRATVSRLLAEAKRQGIVRIEVVPPAEARPGDLADQLARALKLESVYLSAPLPIPAPGRTVLDVMGRALAPAVGRALSEAGLLPGDVLLVSSGRTVYEVAQHELTSLPGVVVAPTVGGNDQPEEWYQTNEITRLVANRVGGRANYLFAPALPGPELYRSLLKDPSIQRVLHQWPTARCALMGVGAPPLTRSDIPRFVPTGSSSLRAAVGDVCSRFYDRAGAPVHFEGSDRLIALELESLHHVPVTIAVAVGQDKISSITAGARGGYFKQLVTDPVTAQALLDDVRTGNPGKD
ncbi:sugar-binding transcriptional regulator [Mycolicibacterium grossiae]|uniref:RNA polymerase subunit sigma-70 n=1 Tax=Mycolicibacterium grossiae TaxID=1552759 RepID=A0A1E8QAG9_9MYCO|nr:sugar-binding domain-containing protein [Mycolicibacterium grossiae]OFJ55406.1 RNA polymerase subunit sigma-70 [Mycolicibacterium grossiae]QEM47000.1 MarR family transcriptional regulator [Mycolicibacterium grossiae]